MQQQINWARGKPDEHVAFEWQARSAAFARQWHKAQERSRHAMRWACYGASAEAVVLSPNLSLPSPENRKLKLELPTLTKNALKLARGRASLPRAALALAFCGQTDQAKTLVDELTKRYPGDTVIHSIWLPVIRAATDLRGGNAAGTIEQLRLHLVTSVLPNSGRSTCAGRPI